LIKPVQRITKYPLLIRELINHVPEDSEEFKSLSAAKKKLEDVLSGVNEDQRSKENSERILQIQNSIEKGDKYGLLAPGRQLLMEGVLGMSYSPQDLKNGKIQDSYSYLFDDKMLITKGSNAAKHKTLNMKNSQKPIAVIPLDTCILDDFQTSEDTYLKNFCFEIDVLGTSGKKFCFFSSEEKSNWVMNINDLISNRISEDLERHEMKKKSKTKKKRKTNFIKSRWSYWHFKKKQKKI